DADLVAPRPRTAVPAGHLATVHEAAERPAASALAMTSLMMPSLSCRILTASLDLGRVSSQSPDPGDCREGSARVPRGAGEGLQAELATVRGRGEQAESAGAVDGLGPAVRTELGQDQARRSSGTRYVPHRQTAIGGPVWCRGRPPASGWLQRG